MWVSVYHFFLLCLHICMNMYIHIFVFTCFHLFMAFSRVWVYEDFFWVCALCTYEYINIHTHLLVSIGSVYAVYVHIHIHKILSPHWVSICSIYTNSRICGSLMKMKFCIFTKKLGFLQKIEICGCLCWCLLGLAWKRALLLTSRRHKKTHKLWSLLTSTSLSTYLINIHSPYPPPPFLLASQCAGSLLNPHVVVSLSFSLARPLSLCRALHLSLSFPLAFCWSPCSLCRLYVNSLERTSTDCSRLHSLLINLFPASPLRTHNRLQQTVADCIGLQQTATDCKYCG